MVHKYIAKGDFQIALICLMLFSSYPYVFECLLPLPSLMVSLMVFGGLSFLYLVSHRKNCVDDNIVLRIVAIQIVFWFFLCLYHQDTSYVIRIILLVTSLIMINAVFLNGERAAIRLFKSLNFILFIQVVLGVLAFWVRFVGFSLPEIEFQLQDGRTSVCYYLTCSNIRIGNFMRISGFYDEPGALAYWGMFSLIFNKLFVRNVVYERIVIVALLFTFSIGYIIELFVYYIFFAKKNFTHLVAAFIVALLLSVLLSKMDSVTRGFFDRLVTNRLEVDDSGKLEKNNREKMEVLAKRTFASSPFWGNGAKKNESIGYMADNPYEILANDGIIGYVVVYLPLLFLFIRYDDKYLRCSLIILFIGYQHRPFHINMMHFLYVYLLLYSAQLYKRGVWRNHETLLKVKNKVTRNENTMAYK